MCLCPRETDGLRSHVGDIICARWVDRLVCKILMVDCDVLVASSSPSPEAAAKQETITKDVGRSKNKQHSAAFGTRGKNSSTSCYWLGKLTLLNISSLGNQINKTPRAKQTVHFSFPCTAWSINNPDLS